MNQKGFVNIIIVIGIIVVVAIASFFFLKQRGGAPSTTSQQPTPNNNQSAPVTTSDLCIAEKDKIIDLVNAFENAQVKKDARSVLTLFTSAELPGDSSTYVYLSGSDAAGPRLYSSRQTNFNQSDFKIVISPSKHDSDSCITKVQEARMYPPEQSYYPKNFNKNIGPEFPFSRVASRLGWLEGSLRSTPHLVYFVTIKQNNSWKIDSYLYEYGSMHKYSGWGY